jgi:uncharacterized membrane protein
MDYVYLLDRWAHYLAGVMWIGHLWFFNFVNANFAKTLDAETKKKVVPELMPRALFFFRWGAMFTLITGLILIYFLYWPKMMAGTFYSDPSGMWITMGALFGVIMWFNVWFVIWPAQRKIIAGVSGAGPAAPPELAAKAAMASKINTYLSVPMLFGMMGGAHNLAGGIVHLIVVVIVGFLIAWRFYNLAPKVSTKV